MKKETLIIGGSVVIIIAIIAYFLLEKRKRETELLESEDREKKLSRENTALRNVVSALKNEVNEIIDKKDELSEDVKSQLKSLIEEYKDIDEKVTDELLSVTTLLEIKEDTKAIMGLAKIIERLLKQIYSEDNELRDNARFVDLIEHAKRKNLIENEEYHYLNGLRTIRNEEAHGVGVKKNYNIVSSSLLIGVSIILKLAHVMKQV